MSPARGRKVALTRDDTKTHIEGHVQRYRPSATRTFVYERKQKAEMLKC
jgi:hypothetical protein